jgi:hypothetical protein
MMELTEVLLADDTVTFADSCATADHSMIDHLWRERLAMADLMIGLRPGAGSPSLAIWSRRAVAPSHGRAAFATSHVAALPSKPADSPMG